MDAELYIALANEAREGQVIPNKLYVTILGFMIVSRVKST